MTWTIYEHWIDEPQGGGRGWKTVSSHSNLEEAEQERKKLIAEDKLCGHKMSFCIEQSEAS